MARRIAVTILCLSFFMLIPSSLCAGLSAFQFKIIKIAFMNGYVRALRTDDRSLRILRENRDIMERVVKAEAEKYMAEVSAMNQTNPASGPSPFSGETFKGTSDW